FLEQYAKGERTDSEGLGDIIADDPVRPWNILAITFTNKAAGELKKRLEERLGPVAADIHASTFHSLCVRILRRDIGAIGYGGNFTIYDTDDSLRVIKDGLKECRIEEKVLPARAVLSTISRAKDVMQTAREMAAAAGNDYRMASIAKVYDYYQNTLRAANALDFDDIIVNTVRLFLANPDILDYYQNRFKYIMVDEYQDTNQTQYKLISLLAAKHHNLCVVGDDDQSIYKFRGATIENILSFESQFEGAEVIRLEQNYRSTQNILSAANAVIANNTARKGKNLWTSAGDGDQIRLVRARDELEESRVIADAILNNVKNGGAFSDNAVLYRMNAQSNSVERALARNAIPYRIVGGLRFYERKEIKDMVAYLSVLENRGDALRLTRIINEPKRGIGASTLQAAQEIADITGETLYHVIAHADEYAPLQRKSGPLMEFAAMMDALAGHAEQGGLDTLLDELLEKTGYLRYLEAQGFEGISRIENIMELKTNILKYIQENEEPTLSGFLEEIALYTDLDNYDRDADAVILMTIHSAKGLEFEHVFIAGMDEGIFPGKSAMMNPGEIEEERRLAYVAITRAKRALTILSAERRMIFGQTVWSRPSRFTGEIPKDFMETNDRTIQKKPKMPAPASAVVGGRSGRSIGVAAAPQKAVGETNFRQGDMVSHKVFGEGKVLSTRPMGGDLLVEIDFDGPGVKKLMANFARLAKL
ncbi:MAG: UvrD-helicase domain-containing protein, partial [Oscillospiraceae bacterium]|nr:UvrD-helicase domain-containing protein [Oscillospiraceae bacterium]